MPLTIIVPEEVIDEPAMVELAGAFQRRSSSNSAHAMGSIYTFSENGESKMTRIAYDVCNAYGCILDNGMWFVRVPLSILDNLVDVDFPDSKYIDENGNEQRRQWQDYSGNIVELTDGTYRMRCNHTAVNGSTVSLICDDAERKLWQEKFPDEFLIRGEGLLLEVKPLIEDEE